MVYAKTDWKDHVVDATNGAIIQQGTPVSAANLNKMENGILEAHAQLEGASRQVQTLQHGLNVLNGTQTAPVNIQIEGRTLVSMGNTPLESLKNYVLADKNTKLKFTNNTYRGPAKLTGENGKPQIIRIANFEDKIAGSMLENPHVFKKVANVSLLPPSDASFTESITNAYSNASSLNGTVAMDTLNQNGKITQQLFSFDLIAEVERNIGRIPRSTILEKVQWLKDNINRLTFNYYGYGSGPAGSKINLSVWNGTAYSQPVHHSNTVATARIGHTGLWVDSTGFIHYLAYAEASDGLIFSVVNTEYIEIEIELKQDAVLHDPCIPLFEVDSSDYAKILVDWNEAEVLNRYPKVQGIQHLQNPVIKAEGENLLPSFYEWSNSFNSIGNSLILDAYSIKINSTASYQEIYVLIPVLSGRSYTFSARKNNNRGELKIKFYKTSTTGEQIGTNLSTQASNALSFTVPQGANYVGVFVGSGIDGSGSYTFSDPMLTLGSTAKPFVPRNPSYLYTNVKLGALVTDKDRLYNDGQDWKISKTVEKDVILDGKMAWLHSNDFIGFKEFSVASLIGVDVTRTGIQEIIKYNGSRLRISSTSDSADKGIIFASTGRLNVNVSDVDTGFSENYQPTADEIKAYFNGWKVKTADTTTSKPIAWKSIEDGTDAPTQSLAYVVGNKAANFTPYKLSYALATPQIMDASRLVEGNISIAGQTQVTVDSGVIMREKTIPTHSTANKTYVINDQGTGYSKLSNRSLQILEIYKNGVPDILQWTLASSFAFGKDRRFIAEENFDPTAEYTVTYLAYDREKLTTNAVNVQATFANNVRSAIEDVAKRSEDNATNISINAMLLYNVIKRLKAGGL